MLRDPFILGALICLVFSIGAQLRGWTYSWLAGLLVSLMVLPISVYSFGTPMTHFGIAPSVPSLMLYAIPLIGLVIALRATRTPPMPKLLVGGSCLYLATGGLFVWDGNPTQWSGILHLSLAGLAYVVGLKMAKAGYFTGRRYLWVLRVIFGILILELVFCLAQLGGVPLSAYQEQFRIFAAEGRALGTFNHPSTLGKFCLLTLALILPGTSMSDSRPTVRISWAIAMLCIPLCGLTVARANTAGVIVAVLVWILFDRTKGRKPHNRVAAIGFAIGVSIPASNAALARFKSDPSGGQRSHLMEVGMPFVRESFWSGLGPNYYVEVVGRVDATTASGFPIHNTFLLETAELGIVGAALLFAPLVWTLLLALRRWQSLQSDGAWARAYLATVPGLLVAALTGWGLASGTTLAYWFLVAGVSVGQLARPASQHDIDKTSTRSLGARSAPRPERGRTSPLRSDD